MQQDYREKYYHNKETMEELLFRKGEILTRIDLTKSFAIFAFGFILDLIGTAFLQEGDTEEIGIFVIVIASITTLIGIIGMILYPIGLNMLERAELLYNTRLAFEKPKKLPENVKPNSIKSKTKFKDIPVLNQDVDFDVEENVITTEFEDLIFDVVVRENGDWICPECCREMPKEVTKCKCGFEIK